MIKRTRFVYGALAAIWVILVGWQIVEHARVRQRELLALRNTAGRYARITTTVIRSQRGFGGWSFRDRLEPALTSLIKANEVNSILVLNETEEILAAAGDPFDPKLLDDRDEYRTNNTIAIATPVELGTNVTSETTPQTLPRVFPDRIPQPGPSLRTNEPPSTNTATIATAEATNAVPATTNELASAARSGQREGGRGDRPPRGPRGRGFGGRPPGMTDEEYRARGVHSFIIVLPTEDMRIRTNHDLWMRLAICLLAAVAVVGNGVAWRNIVLSSELEVRLVRASELNARLKEMNLAAAGLAHETRNPLNIIRGLAQLISKQSDASPEVRVKTREILDEADRVTAQLNEFINYSRPREVRRAAVPLGSVVGEVVRALNYDIEEKVLRLEVQNNLPTISADEQLLRQALFNLLLNATQALERGGEIHVTFERTNGSEAALEIRDNGPGVPVEQRKEIFKPYFTTNLKGTGLGLAVVQQIVLAHGWEIECRGNEPRGAIFRISHMRLAAGA